MDIKKDLENCKTNSQCKKDIHVLDGVPTTLRSKASTVYALNKEEEINMGKVKDLAQERFERNLDRICYGDMSPEQEDKIMAEVLAEADKQTSYQRQEMKTEAYNEGYTIGRARAFKDMSIHFAIYNILVLVGFTYLITL